MKILPFVFQTPNMFLSPERLEKRREKEQQLPADQQPKRIWGILKLKKTTAQVRLEAAVRQQRLPGQAAEIPAEALRQMGEQAGNKVEYALRAWVNEPGIADERRNARGNTANAIWKEVNGRHGALEVFGTSGQVRIVLSENAPISRSLKKMLKSNGISIAMPAGGVPRASERTKLMSRNEYQDILNCWESQPGLGPAELPARIITIGRIRAKMKLSEAEERNLDLSDLPGLESLPQFRFTDMTLRVARGQFKQDKLQGLRDLGASVIEINVPTRRGEQLRPGDRRRLPAGPREPRAPRPNALTPRSNTQPRPSRLAAPARAATSAISAAAAMRKSPTFEQQLQKWASSKSEESEARGLVQGIILSWLSGSNNGQFSAQGNAEPLDLSLQATDGLKFSTMPPIPSQVTKLRVTDQKIREVDITRLPTNLRSLDLTGNPLKDIEDKNLPESFQNLIVNIGTTNTLPPRVMRRLNHAQWPHYSANLPGISGDNARNKLDHYNNQWLAILERLEQWVAHGASDRTGREIAVQRLEEWLHQDAGQTADTPLDLSGLDLQEFPPVWPANASIRFIQAQGNQLRELPLSSMPTQLEYLDLRGNQISEMPPELTAAQMGMRARFDHSGTPYETLVREFKRKDVTLHDPRVIDPRERGALTVVLTGNPIAHAVAERYEGRDFNGKKMGPNYLISQDAFNTHLAQEKQENTTEAELLQANY